MFPGKQLNELRGIQKIQKIQLQDGVWLPVAKLPQSALYINLNQGQTDMN
jgi:hypothetical protein